MGLIERTKVTRVTRTIYDVDFYLGSGAGHIAELLVMVPEEAKIVGVCREGGDVLLTFEGRQEE